MEKDIKVRVGVGVCIIRNGEFLIGERLNSHGANTYSFPGGHMEYGENWNDTAIRETLEETGLDIKNPRLLGITNDIFENENKHYITIWVVADCFTGEPKNLEPNKCNGWSWRTLETLPKTIFIPLKNLLKSEFREVLEKEILNSRKQYHN